MEELYVLQFTKSGKLVGVDDSSGGYPYETDSIKNAELWTSADRAIKYARIVRSFGPFRLRQLIYRFDPVL